ncbi:MAG: DUF456 domain-containing protein [Nocardioides sp.]|uniref:DUF456 domain-containing protein n=1 Tax=Nocardioides sp. TaxID=35761 RepID=UPI003F0CFE94
MSTLEVLVAVAILIGMLGIIVPVIPGVLLIAGGIAVWAWQVGGVEAWVYFAVAAVALVVGQVVKYLLPGRQLSSGGIPSSTLWIGAAGAAIGFFVIPVVGMFVGFPLGVYLAEHLRLGKEEAWPATKLALKAVGFSILIELASAVVAAAVWVAGVVAT